MKQNLDSVTKDELYYALLLMVHQHFANLDGWKNAGSKAPACPAFIRTPKAPPGAFFHARIALCKGKLSTNYS